MSETHVSDTKPCSRMRSLSELRGESKVTKRFLVIVEIAILIQSLSRLSVFTSPCTSHPRTIELCYVLAHFTLKYSEKK